MNKLAKYLEDGCISQAAFARKLGTTATNFSLIVRGKHTPSMKLAYAIEKLTNGHITVYDWIDEEEKKEKN